MTYKANTQRSVLIVLFILSIGNIAFTSYNETLFFIYLGLSISIIITLGLNYTLKIEKDLVIYRIYLWNLPIFNKKIDAASINKVIFKRYGWDQKGACLRVEKGGTIRIIRFTPDSVYEELEKFTDVHRIQLHKSKDYLSLYERGRKVEKA
ncbi:hypothetical protein [Halobacillus sp. A5]|uniref:hypothetical protein n=1 Tax=Halobacillus sp. A5 TaxID=2880263 RepID=UPI0020A67EC5|nr:hypothetical protein [Halobacillus sp. A5]MCP3028424.1 hypothetical protein [Halobacillus sp. A5]